MPENRRKRIEPPYCWSRGEVRYGDLAKLYWPRFALNLDAYVSGQVAGGKYFP